MLLQDYVRKNWPSIKIRYGQIHSWESAHGKDQQTNFPRIWERKGQCRLYIPANPGEDAGYIDLYRKSVHPVTDYTTLSSKGNRVLLENILQELLTNNKES